MARWDEDREEILRHWNQLGFIWKIVLLFFCGKKAHSIFYILNRLYIRPDHMVKVGYLHWDSIRNFLRKS